MKLLVVSHPCATAANQGVFAAMQDAGNFEVTLVVPDGWSDEFGNRLNEPPNPALAERFHRVPVIGNGKIVLHAWRKRWGGFLEAERFDAIYVHNEPYSVSAWQLCAANRRTRNPAVFGFYTAQNIAKTYPPPFCWMEAMVYRHSAFSFPVSESVAEILRRKSSRPKATVCPLPVDLQICRPLSAGERQLCIPRAGDELVIGYVGRLVETKGLLTLAAALALLRDLPWKLHVVGRGDFEDPFRERLAAGGILDRVTFAGYVPHVETPHLLASMDMLIVPSETQANWKEQFGRVIVEAMACGTPVIGSDSGEIPHLIGVSGGGVVFPERDPESLAQAVRSLGADKAAARALAESGRGWVSRHLDQTAIAKKMANAIREACKVS